MRTLEIVILGSFRAVIKQRIGVKDYVAADRLVRKIVLIRTGGLRGKQIQRSRRRWPKYSAEAVVVQRKVLRVAPQRGDRIPVVVAHDRLGVAIAMLFRIFGCRLHYVINKPAMISLLLSRISMIHVAGDRIGTI